MTHVYVATSKSLQNWGAEVGLGKHLYALGVCQEGSPEEAIAHWGGRDDWTIVRSRECAGDALDCSTLIERLAKKEKHIAPHYYPALRGIESLFKIDPQHVENAQLLELAMQNAALPSHGSKSAKIKPINIADYILKIVLTS